MNISPIAQQAGPDKSSQIQSLRTQKQNLEQQLRQVQEGGNGGKDQKARESKLERQIARIEKQIQALQKQQNAAPAETAPSPEEAGGQRRRYDEYVKGDAEV